jgi:hypothetical protein
MGNPTRYRLHCKDLQEQDLSMIGALARKLFGSPNDRRVKGYQSRVDAINAAAKARLAKLSDER